MKIVFILALIIAALWLVAKYGPQGQEQFS
jgi:flagellar biogenesis protein FliO